MYYEGIEEDPVNLSLNSSNFFSLEKQPKCPRGDGRKTVKRNKREQLTPIGQADSQYNASKTTPSCHCAPTAESLDPVRPLDATSVRSLPARATLNSEYDAWSMGETPALHCTAQRGQRQRGHSPPVSRQDLQFGFSSSTPYDRKTIPVYTVFFLGNSIHTPSKGPAPKGSVCRPRRRVRSVCLYTKRYVAKQITGLKAAATQSAGETAWKMETSGCLCLAIITNSRLPSAVRPDARRPTGPRLLL